MKHYFEKSFEQNALTTEIEKNVFSLKKKIKEGLIPKNELNINNLVKKYKVTPNTLNKYGINGEFLRRYRLTEKEIQTIKKINHFYYICKFGEKKISTLLNLSTSKVESILNSKTCREIM